MRRSTARPAAPSADARSAEMLVALGVAGLTCMVFLPALGGGFLPWDDEANLVVNRAWRGLGPSQLGWMLTSFHKGHWIPVTWLSFALDHVLWGMDPRGYHLTSVLVHGANAGLVCLLAMRLLEAGRGAERLAGGAAAALAFALHPLRVESVAWVTERRDVLSAFFFLVSLLAYLRAVREEPVWRSRWYWLALGAFALSLGSKSMAVSLPVVLLILDMYPLARGRGAWRLRLIEKAPFALLSLLAAAVATVAVRAGGSVSSLADLGVAQRLAISSYSVVFYLWKTLVPAGLSPLYELPLELDPGAAVYRLSMTLVIAIPVAALVLRRRQPWLLAAWAAYVVMLLPVVGIAHNGPQIAADRYTYLPCLPWVILLGGLVALLWSRSWSIPVAGAALGLLAWLTIGQIRVWHDPEALWTHALLASPSAVAHSSLGVALDERGRSDEAIAHFQQALRVNPRLAHAENNWGIALAKQGRWEEAARHYEAALRIDQRHAEAHANLAVALGRLGRYAEAQRHMEEARALVLSRTR
ncbi:MAG TPA: tetratricopeptide repeat protein [Methylomirabilota bacterium]|nr:tetratricopeptide repeat protein [Methylomirabilota bacterium]